MPSCVYRAPAPLFRKSFIQRLLAFMSASFYPKGDIVKLISHLEAEVNCYHVFPQGEPPNTPCLLYTALFGVSLIQTCLGSTASNVQFTSSGIIADLQLAQYRRSLDRHERTLELLRLSLLSSRSFMTCLLDKMCSLGLVTVGYFYCP